MKKFKNIESFNAKALNAIALMANAYGSYRESFYAVSYSLFWSVFGPAAQYNYRQPAYAYGLMKP